MEHLLWAHHDFSHSRFAQNNRTPLIIPKIHFYSRNIVWGWGKWAIAILSHCDSKRLGTTAMMLSRIWTLNVAFCGWRSIQVLNKRDNHSSYNGDERWDQKARKEARARGRNVGMYTTQRRLARATFPTTRNDTFSSELPWIFQLWLVHPLSHVTAFVRHEWGSRGFGSALWSDGFPWRHCEFILLGLGFTLKICMRWLLVTSEKVS